MNNNNFRNSWSMAAIAGVCLSLTSMASLINVIIALAVNVWAYLGCRKSKKQGLKLSLIGILLTLVSIVISIKAGLFVYFVVSFILVSFLISAVIFGCVYGIMYYLDQKNAAAGVSLAGADWVGKYGKLLFVIYPLGWSKTKMVVVDSRDGTPYYVEKFKSTFGDRTSYSAEELSWKEVRRYAEDSSNADIKVRFAEVDANNWWKFTRNR